MISLAVLLKRNIQGEKEKGNELAWNFKTSFIPAPENGPVSQTTVSSLGLHEKFVLKMCTRSSDTLIFIIIVIVTLSHN